MMIGHPAPEWRATAYFRGACRDVGSDDFKGRWYVIYWYVLDFTPLCPTEINSFEELLCDFADDAVAVIGVSTDSFYSHKMWFADRRTFPRDITHPVVADNNHAVSRAFGVLLEEQGIAHRATVIVDDRGLVRSIAINDLGVCRSPREVLRTVQALRAGGPCGADWHKGESFVAS